MLFLYDDLDLLFIKVNNVINILFIPVLLLILFNIVLIIINVIRHRREDINV